MYDGVSVSGINQTQVSVETIRDFNRAWRYATNYKANLSPLDTPEDLFVALLDKLEAIDPGHDSWDPVLINLLQIKQWHPQIFATLTKKYAAKIAHIGNAMPAKCGIKEARILKAIAYDPEKLAQATHDENVKKEVLNDFQFCNLPIPTPEDLEISDGHLPYLIGLLYTYASWNTNTLLNSQSGIISIILQLKIGCPEALQELGASALRVITEKIAPIVHAKMRPYQMRLERFPKVFDLTELREYSDDEKNMITKGFPIIMASTKLKSHDRKNGEFNIDQAKLGKEIDVIFMYPQDMPLMQRWLIDTGLDKSVRLLDIHPVLNFNHFALTHAQNQVIGLAPAITDTDYEKMNDFFSSNIAHLYRRPYLNGNRREIHGTVHAARTALLGMTLVEMYKEKNLHSKNIHHLFVSLGLHDTERGDDGPDIWDALSAQKIQEVLLQRCFATQKESEFFSNCMAHKDDPGAQELDQKIIHDADCLEILRLVKINDFLYERLWISKDFDQDFLLNFVKEVNEFITLTEKTGIKEFIENSQEPLKVLHQILNYCAKSFSMFSLLHRYNFSAEISLCQPKDYVISSIENALLPAQLRK